MSATLRRRMTRRRLRFAALLAVAALAACVFVATAAALAFSDDSCDNTKPCRPPTGIVGNSYSHILKPIAPDTGNGPPYSYELISGSLPPGLSLASNGPITGTPTQSGTWVFWAQLSDNPEPDTNSCCPGVANPFWCKTRGTCAQRDFTITIDPGLRIVTNAIPQLASVGDPYSTTLEAQLVTNLNPPTGSAPGPLTWSVAGGALPPGLTLANGVISGTPTTEGAYTFKIEAAIDASRKHAQTYSLTVRQPLKITAPKPFATVPLPTAWEVGVPFSGKLTPSGGSGTYTYTLAAGSLPTGLALGADGTVLGTPRAPGVFRSTLRLADSEGRTADYAANFGVAARLAVSTLALRPGKVGRLYRAKVASTGGLLPRKWKILKGPLPKGVRFDRVLGILSGTPTKAGRYRVTFQVTDGLKVVAKKTLRIDILDA
jgi:large repetitive protein